MLTDPDWQDWATINASKGYPWAVWISQRGGPLCLAASKATEQEAKNYKERLKIGRARYSNGQDIIIVCNEGENNETV